MKINTAKTAIIASIAIALSVATPVFAANYPPTITKIVINNSSIVIGSSTVPVKNVIKLTKTSATASTKINTPLRLTISGVKPGSVVHSTLLTPAKKTIVLPDIVANSKGLVDTKAMALKIAGKYVLYYWLPNGTYKAITITVKK